LPTTLVAVTTLYFSSQNFRQSLVFTTVETGGLLGDLWSPSSKAHGCISCIQVDEAQLAILDSRSVQQEQEATRAKRYDTYLQKMEGNRILFRTPYRTTHKNMVGQVEVGRNWLCQISAAPISEENHKSTRSGPHYFAQKPPCTSQIK
jgi:hypothetical protein